MRILLSVVFLCLYITTQAQKKNEIQIGVPAAYFFDDTPYRFHGLKRGAPLPTHISYARLFLSKYGLSLSFDYLWLVYDIHALDNYPGKILFKGYSKISMEFYRQKKLDRFSIRGKIGTGYRLGGEVVHLSYSYTNAGVIWERRSSFNRYNNPYITIGVQTKYRLFGNLSAVAQVNLSRHFSKYSPNELQNVLAFSYGF